MRKLVEVPEVLIPGVATRACGYTSISRLCRGMTAFIHYNKTLSLSLFLSHSLTHSHCVLFLCFEQSFVGGFVCVVVDFLLSQKPRQDTIYYTPLPTFFFFSNFFSRASKMW